MVRVSEVFLFLFFSLGGCFVFFVRKDFPFLGARAFGALRCLIFFLGDAAKKWWMFWETFRMLRGDAGFSCFVGVKFLGTVLDGFTWLRF